jgi:hypothetical protein
MAKNNRGGINSSRNNNPSGKNQYSGGVMDLARERPVAAAAVAAGAAAAGLFLWSKRSQISDQMSNLSDQLGQWTENMRSGSSGDGWSSEDDTAGLTTTGRSRSTSSSRNRGMSETGGGNASMGSSSGGAGNTASATGRGRAQSQPVS